MTVKIEEGKFYIDAEGDKCGPMRPTGDVDYPWIDQNTFWYSDDGTWHGAPRCGDLISEYNPAIDTRRITGSEYKSALFSELAKDDAKNEGHEIPPRIYALINRAFIRAHAGEFKT